MVYGLNSLFLENFGHPVKYSSVLASCPVADLGLFKQTSDFVATSAVSWTLYPWGRRHLQLWDETCWERGCSETKCLELRGRDYSLYCVYEQVPHHMRNPYAT